MLALRHQLTVLRRKARKRLAFRSFNRHFFASLYRIAPSVVNARNAAPGAGSQGRDPDSQWARLSGRRIRHFQPVACSSMSIRSIQRMKWRMFSLTPNRPRSSRSTYSRASLRRLCNRFRCHVILTEAAGCFRCRRGVSLDVKTVRGGAIERSENVATPLVVEEVAEPAQAAKNAAPGIDGEQAIDLSRKATGNFVSKIMQDIYVLARGEAAFAYGAGGLALFAMLALGLGLMASPAEAAPFACRES
jgi:hypothetical protein